VGEQDHKKKTFFPILRSTLAIQCYDVTMLINGLGPGIALGSTRVFRSVWRDPQISSFYLPGATPLECPGFPSVPLRWTHHVLAHTTEHSLSFIFGFCQIKYFNILLLILTE
jgi:hypothetical protein